MHGIIRSKTGRACNRIAVERSLGNISAGCCLCFSFRVMMSIFLMGLTILFAHGVGTVAGFGPTVLAMPFMLLLRDIYFVRPLLTIFGLCVTSTVLIRSYKHVNVKVALLILLVAGGGLPIGMLVYSFLPQNILLLSVGIFTLFISIRGIIEEFFPIKKIILPNWALYIILILAGIIHGAFTTGGPLLVIYTSQRLRDKSEFRATQVTVWVVFNTILSLQLFLFNPAASPGQDWASYRQYLMLLPFLVAAIVLGSIVEKKVSLRTFRKLIYLMLCISSCSILLPFVAG